MLSRPARSASWCTVCGSWNACWVARLWRSRCSRRHCRLPGKRARLAVAVAATGCFAVKVVADTLSVARSTLVNQLKSKSRFRAASCSPASRGGSRRCWHRIRCNGLLTVAQPAPPAKPSTSPSPSRWFPASHRSVAPESNGVSETFVKTIKRDDARILPRPDACTVLRQLPAWIDDFTENQPHSSMELRSHGEFVQSQSKPALCAV